MEACLLACYNIQNTTLPLDLVCFNACYLENGWTVGAAATSSQSSEQRSINILIACALLLLSGLFSGLTLGLMSLDMVSLEILSESGEEMERVYAKKIIPVRAKGNLLLCTLLLGNTMVNALIAILMADLTDGLVGLALSTLSIVVFGEILPQAACSRHGLYIGAHSIWIVKTFIVLMYIVAWPISVCLDKILGRDIGQVYSAEELHHLIRIHIENPDAQEESGLNRDDGNLLTGALEYKEKKVADVMTTLDKVFMVESHTRLTFQVLMDLYKSGFTRIPVYEIDRQNIIGILFTKDLILIDPDDEVEIAAVISFHGSREGGFVRGVPDDTSLDKVFREFKTSYLHLLVAYGEVGPGAGRTVEKLWSSVVKNEVDDLYGGFQANQHISDYTADVHSLAGNRRVVTGVITLEDVLEAVIKDEIVDESDNFVDVNKAETMVQGRWGGHRPDPTNFLTLFEHKIRDQTKLSDAEINAIVAFLSLNVAEFKKLARFGGVLKKLIKASQVEERDVEEEAENSKYVGTPPVRVDTDDATDTRPHTTPTRRFSAAGGPRYSAGSGTPVGDRPPSRASVGFEEDRHSDDGSLGGPIYCKGFSCDFFTLILQGKVTILAGSDDFTSELGPWCYIGVKALTLDPFVPDFRASPQGSCRLLHIRRGDYKDAMRAAQAEALNGSRSAAGSRHAATGDGDDLDESAQDLSDAHSSRQRGASVGGISVDMRARSG
mmetsp:Transcript_44265/g.71035  ORF Transcript_44265/g.71035 Transcript_44265/m.71035 type:complete len:721 (-) Transcript_44265:233-2395(-)